MTLIIIEIRIIITNIILKFQLILRCEQAKLEKFSWRKALQMLFQFRMKCKILYQARQESRPIFPGEHRFWQIGKMFHNCHITAFLISLLFVIIKKQERILTNYRAHSRIPTVRKYMKSDSLQNSKGLLKPTNVKPATADYAKFSILI